MKFEYLTVSDKSGRPLLDSRGKSVKRPILWLQLEGVNGISLTTPALVDSGADTSTMNVQFAKELGVELGEEGNILGIGQGVVKRWAGNIQVKIKSTNFKFNIPVWFVDSDNVNMLLGQEVFFDLLRIKFEKDHNIFEITPAPGVKFD